MVTNVFMGLPPAGPQGPEVRGEAPSHQFAAEHGDGETGPGRGDVVGGGVDFARVQGAMDDAERHGGEQQRVGADHPGGMGAHVAAPDRGDAEHARRHEPDPEQQEPELPGAAALRERREVEAGRADEAERSHGMQSAHGAMHAKAAAPDPVPEQERRGDETEQSADDVEVEVGRPQSIAGEPRPLDQEGEARVEREVLRRLHDQQRRSAQHRHRSDRPNRTTDPPGCWPSGGAGVHRRAPCGPATTV
jgi:hypothetical protein